MSLQNITIGVRFVGWHFGTINHQGGREMSYQEISRAKRKARKTHTCDWCSRTIEKGEEYEHSTNTFAGEIYPWKACYKCKDDVEKMFKDDYYNREGYCTTENFQEYMRDREVE